MKNEICIVVLSFSATAFAALPSVSVGALTQNPDSKRVIIPYTLTEGDACIVTVDVKTNGPSGYASIGGERLWTLWGDVNKKIPAGAGDKRIFWNPATAGFECELSDLKAEVSVWSLDNPPDYMVLDLGGRKEKEHRFYPNAGQIPLGVANDIYKTDYLVMRKIPAAGVTWRMGAGTYESPIASDSTLHLVTLKNDFYLSVFEVTQGQFRNVGLASVITDVTTFKNAEDSYYRPVEGVCWFNIRSKNTWPSGGHELGTYTYFKYFVDKVGGFTFDLPTESEWEFACRAGTKTKYNNGSSYDLDPAAWYVGNSTNKLTNVAETHPVGLKQPNSWGLYDMMGNVREWCLDYYRENYGVGDEDYDGVDFKGPPSCDPGLCANNNARVLRGGNYKNNAFDVKSAARNWGPDGSTKNSDVGFRIWCPVAYPL